MKKLTKKNVLKKNVTIQTEDSYPVRVGDHWWEVVCVPVDYKGPYR